MKRQHQIFTVTACIVFQWYAQSCSFEAERQSDRGQRLDAKSTADSEKSFPPVVSQSPSPTPSGIVQSSLDPVASVAAVARNLRIVGFEDVPLKIPLAVEEKLRNFIKISIQSPPRAGKIEVESADTLLYSPQQDFFGNDQIVLSVSFSENNVTKAQSTATIDIVLNAVNDFPVAKDTRINVTEDVPAPFELLANDVDGDPLKYEILEQPRNGKIENFDGKTGKGRYVPKLNQTGSDFFRYQVSDPSGSKSAAFGLIDLGEVNDAPLASAQTVRTNEDVAVAIQLVGFDVDSETLNFKIVPNSGPSNGIISGFNAATGALLYTPSLNQNGPDQFSFTVSDGQAESNAAIVQIIIDPVNDLPVLGGKLAVETQEGSPVSFFQSATDVETPNALTFQLVQAPQKGRVIGTIANAQLEITYTPDRHANGRDEISYRISDGLAVSDLKTTVITIVPVNDPPRASNVVINAGNRASVTSEFSAFDPDDGDVLSFALDSSVSPRHGTVSIPDPLSSTFVYTANRVVPDGATDSFRYQVKDQSGAVADATVFINLSVTNTKPVANNMTLNIEEDSVGQFNLVAFDGDNDPVTFKVTQPPSHGVITVNGLSGAVEYRPNRDFNGSDSIKFIAHDGLESSTETTVMIQVAPVNDPPSIRMNEIFVIDEDSEPMTVPLVFEDVDNPSQIFNIEVPLRSPHGALSVVGQLAKYKPDANFFGIDSFTVRASDGELDSPTLTVFVTVRAVNDRPVASDVTFNILEDNVLDGLFPASDVDGDALIARVLPLNPQLFKGEIETNGSGLRFTYIPPKNFVGKVSFQYVVKDHTLESEVRTVEINIGEVNDSPVASSETFRVDEDSELSGILVASDPDGPNVPLTFFITKAPLNGVLTVTGKDFTYRPNKNFDQTDQFEFVASDGQAISNVATVTINVNPINDPPTIEPFSSKGIINAEQRFRVVVSDVDGDPLTLTIMTQGQNGVATIDDGFVVYNPSPGFVGIDTVVIRVSDGTLNATAEGRFEVENPAP